MAGIKIGAKEGILLGGGLGATLCADQVGVRLQNALHTLRRLELLRKDAHRYAGPARLAGRAVGDVLRTTKAALRQKIVEFGSLVPDQMREHLTLELPGQIRAWRGRREEKLR